MNMPKIMYGTAWKKSDTCRLVTLALENGFKGIDTACQPKHYHEPGVGEALVNFNRQDIFLQTKFTSFNGQDPATCPYDKSLPLEQQIITSFETSLKNLKTDYIDSLVLHGPLKNHAENMVLWRQFETFVERKQVRMLGISNFYDLNSIERLYNDATIKPRVIQNRFYADTDYDKDIRKFCKEKDIIYQSFWTLSANPHVLENANVRKAAEKRGVPATSLFFAYLHQTGVVVPLTGTKNVQHMKDDLLAVELTLSEEEMNIFKRLVG
ncbi:hypothetical protein HA402_008997 [Bradysia odoriphaga]|nr:hypothetical protein HA402_008997 [Bradysia odoriphaga]